ncbi:hypothetical protein OCU04_006956 [Sclerotinia nivalis]|uniref:Uncharacterized protein n=1 Tax=Sclerotinia nivalis TaxID=352851 RepID=A0A9X0AKX8_9HELO|nr:hypothetical protein OCU04_006956 [Sclerotinia nivalis]
MHFLRLAFLAILPFGFCAPTKSSALARDAHGSDERVVYPDYRRATGDESVVYPDYRRGTNDESVIYPDYRRSVADRYVDAAKEDESVIYPDYRRDIN